MFVRDRTKSHCQLLALQVAKEGMPLVLKVEALTQSIINQGTDVAYHVRIGLSQFYGHRYAWENIEKLSNRLNLLGSSML